MLDQQQTWIILALVAATAVLFSKRSKPPLPYPPGPNRLPIIGNLLDVPKSHPWETYMRWGKECASDIIFVKYMGTNILILNSLESALDLLDKRSAKYSSRPSFVMANEIAGWKWLPGLMPYGKAWRERRKLFQKHFNPSDPSLYQYWQIHYTKKMLESVLESPDKFWEHMDHVVAGAMISIAYGLNVQAKDDPYVKLAVEGSKSLIETSIPGRYLVDSLPFLKYIPDWFPGAGFKREGREFKKLTDRFREEPFLAAVEAMNNSSAQPCFVSKCLQNLAENTTDSAEIKQEIRIASMDMAAGIFLGGSDTIMAGVGTFLLTMVCYPEIQKKAQEELDRVVGHGRLPEFEDEKTLPYLSAIIKEVYRWRPTVPAATPHTTTEDDEYRGYYIPKDTAVINNVWAILHDPKAYRDPHRFSPERFLTRDGQRLDPDVRDPSVAAFGFGRRVCPGMQAGISATWLIAAYILSAFNLKKPMDPVTGEVIEPSMEYHSAVVYAPVPFKMKITPRSDKAVKMISMLAD